MADEVAHKMAFEIFSIIFADSGESGADELKKIVEGFGFEIVFFALTDDLMAELESVVMLPKGVPLLEFLLLGFVRKEYISDCGNLIDEVLILEFFNGLVE